MVITIKAKAYIAGFLLGIFTCTAIVTAQNTRQTSFPRVTNENLFDLTLMYELDSTSIPNRGAYSLREVTVSADDSIIGLVLVDDSVASAGPSLIQVWNAADGEFLCTFVGGGPSESISILFSPDNETIAVSGEVSGTHLYDLCEVNALFDPIATFDTQGVAAMAYSPDSSLFAVSRAQQTTLWNIEAENIQTEVAFDQFVSALAFHPNNSHLLVGTIGKVYLWAFEDDVYELIHCDIVDELDIATLLDGISVSSDGNLILAEQLDEVYIINGINNEHVGTYKGTIANGSASIISPPLVYDKRVIVLSNNEVEDTFDVNGIMYKVIPESNILDVNLSGQVVAFADREALYIAEASNFENKMQIASVEGSKPDVGFSPSGSLILYVDEADVLQVWAVGN